MELLNARPVPRTVLDAILILYWFVIVGMGVMNWLLYSGRMSAGVLASVLHWMLFSLLLARGGAVFLDDLSRNIWPGPWALGMGTILILTTIDGAARTGLTDYVTVSSAMAALFIGSFSYAFRDKPATRLVAVAAITILACQIAYLSFELYHDLYLSRTLGRPAGLLVNPNVAGGVLTLLGLSTVSRVPERWRLAFLAGVGYGIVLTLSRSSLLAFSLGVAWLTVWQVRTAGWRPLIGQVPLALVVCVAGGISIAASIDGENRYQYALEGSLGGFVRQLVGSDRAVAEARAAKALRSGEYMLRNQARIGSGAKTPGRDGIPTGDLDLEDLEDLSPETLEAVILEQSGDFNSALSRVVLLERALREYLQHPFLGQGSAAAFDLRSHNAYLFAGNAWGIVGVLAVLLFLAGYFVPGPQRVFRCATGLAAVVLGLFSHGLLINMPLVMAVAASTALLGTSTETDHRPISS